MDEMTFYVRDETIRSNVMREILKGKLPLNVKVSEAKKKRSLPQNNLYWKHLTLMEEATGHTKEELHDIFRLRFLPKRDLDVDGIVYKLPISTTELTTKEFSKYMDNIRLTASELDVVLPYPDYYGY